MALVSFSLVAHGQYLTNQIYLLGFGDLNQVTVPYEPSQSMVDGNYLYHVTYSNGSALGNYLLLKKHHMDGTPVWEATYGNIGPMTENHGVDLKVDGSGNIYVIGATKHLTEGYNTLILKYNSTGAKLWEYHYHSVGSNDDLATALDLDGAGNCYVTGQTGSGSGADVFVLKLDQNGAFGWSSTFDHDAMADGGIWIEYLNASSIDVLAITQDDGEDFQLSRLNFNGAGVLQSSSRTNIGYGGMQITDLVKSGSDYLVCGSVMNLNGDWDLAVYKLSGTMTSTWSYIQDEAGEDDFAYTIAEDASGNIYCGGQVSEGTPFFRLVQLSSLGVEQKEYLGDNYPNSSIKDLESVGNKILTAISIEADQDQMLCALFDNTLEPVWEKKVAPSTYEVVPVQCMALSSKSFVYVSLKEAGGVTTFQTRRFDLFDEELTVEEDGHDIVQNQVAVQLWPDLINTTFTDDENLEFAWLSDVITPPTLTWLKDSVDTISWDSIRCRKIFPSFKSTDVTRTGNHDLPIDLPKLYTHLVLYFDEDINEVATAGALDGLDNIFVYAEIDEIPQLAWTPNDPKLSLQPALVPNTTLIDVHIGMDDAWDIEKGKDYIRLGVFDTGILWFHEEFSKDGSRNQSQSKVIDGYSIAKKKAFFDLKDNKVDNNDMHGTWMAGIAAAITNNNKGIAGVAGGDASNNEYGISLVAFQMFPKSVGGTPKSRIADYIAIGADKNKALRHHLSNHSWSSKTPKILAPAIYTSYLLGTVQATASGNDKKEDDKLVPANYADEMVLKVGNVDINNERVERSNWGHDLDFVAPGTPPVHEVPNVNNIQGSYGSTTVPNDEYHSGGIGTSQSTAHVSGVAGLLLSNWNSQTAHNQNLVQEDVEYLLSIGAQDIEYNNDNEEAVAGYDGFTGWGLVQADRSLQYLQAPNFDLQHIITTATSQDVTQIATDVEIEIVEEKGYTGLKDGKYKADVYKVEVSTSHSWPSHFSIHYVRSEHPGYWVANSLSNLWDYNETAKTTHAHNGVEFTSGSTPDAGGATLVGYFFYIKERVRNTGNKTINQWYPHANTDNHVLSYAVHLSRGWNLSLQEQDVEYAAYPNPAQQVLNIRSYNINESIQSVGFTI